MSSSTPVDCKSPVAAAPPSGGVVESSVAAAPPCGDVVESPVATPPSEGVVEEETELCEGKAVINKRNKVE